MRWAWIILLAFPVYAQNINSWQPTQPFGDAGFVSRSSGVCEYGWPSGGSEQPDVREQFLFDEASGSIVGEVNSTTLTLVGANTYGETLEGYFENVSPGIRFLGSTDYYTKAGADTNFDFGTTGDFTGEFIAKQSVATVRYINDMRDPTTFRGWSLILSDTTDSVQMIMKAEDDTLVSIAVNAGDVNVNDSNPHKYRWRLDRDSATGFEVWGDGKSGGTANPTAVSGKDIKAHAVRIGARYDATFEYNGWLYEWRLSNNLTNNSGCENG